MAISATTPTWMQEILESYDQDVAVQSIIQQLSIDPGASTQFQLQQGLIRSNGAIYVGTGFDLRRKIFSIFHESTFGGHSAVQATLKRLSRYFTWPGMNEQVKSWIRECDTCQRHKTETVPYPGLLHPLEIPTKPWADISLDFIEGLPISEGKTVILVIIDMFTKFGHFIGLHRPFSAATVANVFIENIYKLHGLPQSIVSDRDKLFLSTFWQTLFKQLGVKLNITTSYHPQTDSQTERLNMCLECYLRCMTSEHPRRWFTWLPLAHGGTIPLIIQHYNTLHFKLCLVMLHLTSTFIKLKPLKFLLSISLSEIEPICYLCLKLTSYKLKQG